MRLVEPFFYSLCSSTGSSVMQQQKGETSVLERVGSSIEYLIDRGCGVPWPLLRTQPKYTLHVYVQYPLCAEFTALCSAVQAAGRLFLQADPGRLRSPGTNAE